MIQKIITSIHHDVSNPHRFDVIVFDKFVRINVQWNYRTTKVTQLFLVRPYTRATLLVCVPNVALTNVVTYNKKIFLLYATTCRTIFHVNKNFCWHNFFQKIFHNIFFWDGKYTVHFPSWREIFTVFFPYRIYMLFQIYFEINYILQNNFLWHLISCMFWWH